MAKLSAKVLQTEIDNVKAEHLFLLKIFFALDDIVRLAEILASSCLVSIFRVLFAPLCSLLGQYFLIDSVSASEFLFCLICCCNITIRDPWMDQDVS